MTAISRVTQYIFRRLCSSFGMRVANCVHTSSVFVIYAAFFFDAVGRPGARRRLRRRRPFFAFGTGGVAPAFFACNIFSATAFGGRPGPPGRHVPRVLRGRRRPFFALFPVETRPSSDWIAVRTSCCTMSRITVTRLRCLGIESSLPARDTRKDDHQQSPGLSDRSGRGGGRRERR